MRKMKGLKKGLSLLLALSMVLSHVPVASAAAEDGLCEHHTAHTADCGYVPAVAGQDCAHAHDAACGYVEAVAEVLCACTETDESGALVHTEGCGYAAPVAGADCTHAHDDACGYIQAAEGAACAYHCEICHVQELVDALPESVTAENAGTVKAQLGAIDEETQSLSEEDLALVDFARYDAAAEALARIAAVTAESEPTGDDTSAPVCACETRCAEGAVNGDCPLCGSEHADLTQCTGAVPHTHAYTGEPTCEKKDASCHTVTTPCPDCPEGAADVTEEAHSFESGVCTLCGAEEEIVPECTCETRCAEGAVSADCAVCSGENADLANCTGAEAADPVCVCESACDITAINYACAVCAEDFGLCAHYVPTCTCAEKCTRERVNTFCAVCGAEGAELTACTGEDTAVSYAFNSLTVDGVDALTTTSGTGWSYDANSSTLTISGNIGAVNASVDINTRDQVLNIVVTNSATVNGGIYAGGKLNLVMENGATLTVNYSGNGAAIQSGYTGGTTDSITISGDGTVAAFGSGDANGIQSGGGLTIDGVTVAAQGYYFGLHSGDTGFLSISNSKVYAVGGTYGIYVGKENSATASIIGANTVVVAGFALGSASNNYAPVISGTPGGGISANALTANCGHLIIGGSYLGSSFNIGSMTNVTDTSRGYGEYISHLTYQRNGNGTHAQKCADGCPVSYTGTAETCSGTTYCNGTVCDKCGYLDTTTKDGEKHKGGTATCTAKAKCELCQTEYGELDKNNHTGTVSGDYTYVDGTYHSATYTCCGAGGASSEEHTPSADNKLICSKCEGLAIDRVLEEIKNAPSGTTLSYSGVVGSALYPTDDPIAMEIPEGVTVNWGVNISGDFVIASGEALLTLSGGGTLNLTGTISNTNITGQNPCIALAEGSNVTLAVTEGGTVSRSGFASAIKALGGKEVRVESGTVSGGSTGIYSTGSADVTVKGGVITGSIFISSTDPGLVTVSGGTVTAANSVIDTKGAVSVSGSPTITDTGTSTSSAAIWAGSVEISGSPTISHSVGTGITIYGFGPVVFKAGCNATVTGGKYGINSGLVTVEQGAIATVTGGTANGIYYTVAKTITVDGELTVNCTSSNAAVYATGATIAVGASGKLTVKSTGGTGINCASFTVNGTVDATGGTADTKSGIYTTNLTIDGGTVTASGCNAVNGTTVKVKDGVLRADGNNIGVRFKSMTVSGSSHITATGDGSCGADNWNDNTVAIDGDYYWCSVAEANKPTDLHGYSRSGLKDSASGETYFELLTRAHLEAGTLAAMDSITCDCGDTFSIGSCGNGEEATCAKGAVCGTCGITYTGKDTSKHVWGYSAAGNVITATCTNGCNTTATVTLNAPERKTYDDGKNASATTAVEPTGVLTNLPNIIYSGRDGTSYASSTTAPTNAGNYTASITIGEGDNKATATVDYTISKKSLTADQFYFDSPWDVTYDGRPKVATVKENTGAEGVGEVTVEYYDYESGAKLDGAPTDAGTYTVKINVAEGTIYAAATGLGSPGWTFTIIKANPTYTLPTGLTATYGQTLADVQLPTADNGTWSWESTADAVGNVGTQTHEATFTPSDTKNYETVNNIEVSVEVGKANPTCTVPDNLTATYGDTLGSVTLTTAAGDTPGAWTWNDDASTSVGNAGIRTFKAAFTPTDTANYNTLTDIAVTVHVAKATPTITWGSASQTVNYTGQAAVITAPNVTLKDNESFNYSFTYSYTGTSNGKNVSGNGLPINAGTYQITASVEAQGSYAAATSTNTLALTIQKADPAYTAPAAKTGLTYNRQPQALVTAGTATGGTIQYSLDGTTWSAGLPKAANAGDYTVYYKILGDANHNDLTPQNNSVTVSIGKAKVEKLTITANDLRINAGEAPAFGGTVTGLLSGDTLAKAPTYICDYQGSTGVYTITPSDADAGGNYEVSNIEYISGTLYALAPGASIQSKLVVGGLTTAPAGMPANADTVEEIKEILENVLVQQLGSAPAAGTAHYDVKLQFSLDGGNTWIDATEENFPLGGLTVTLPYPQGTGKNTHDFKVVHMFTVTSSRLGTDAGDTESPDVAETDSGLQFVVNGLSPISLTWTSSEFGITAASSGKGTVTVSHSKAAPGTLVTITATPGSRWNRLKSLTVTDAKGKELPLTSLGDGKVTFTMPESGVTVIGTFGRAWDPSNPKTGDSFNIALWGAILCASALGIGILPVIRKRKNQK